MLNQFVKNCSALFLIFLLPGYVLPLRAQNAPPLSQGQWFKIGVTQTGVYKLSAGYLQQHGIAGSSTNPQHIQLYGQGGGMLPQPNDAPRPQGLQENAIFVAGEADGRLDSQDYILFFAQGPDKYAYEPASGEFTYEKNIYSDTAFYFITIGPVPGKRMGQLPELSTSGPSLGTYTAYAALEEEKYNLLNSGRRWLSERFSAGTTQEYTLPLYQLKDQSNLQIKTAFVSTATSSSSFKVSVNGSLAQEIPLPIIKNPKENPYAEKGFLVEESTTIKASGQEQLQLSIAYEGSNYGATAYLDYVFATGTAHLNYKNTALQFRSLESLQYPEVQYELAGVASGIQLWDISAPQDVKIQPFSLQGNVLSFGSSSSTLREYVAFKDSDVQEPVSLKKVENQYLRGDKSPELVILTNPRLLAEAERLARFRRQYDGLAVKVVTTTQLYNEFSSGAQDLTAIRDYMRFLYPSGRLRYLLLFGRGSFDYKKRKEKDYNLVPVYESYNFTDPVKSYASDDYYGFLEEEEGAWTENEEGNHSLDIGIGRLPVVDLQEARQVVDKLIHYQTSSEAFGSWRNNVLFIADDGDGNVHQRDAEKLAERAENAWPAANISKIYLGAFPQDKVANGERSPKAAEAIEEALNKGTFILNYTGHGSLDLLTNEYIITKAGIEKWQNKNRLPLVVTATCEFGQHDNIVRSGAESMLLNPTGGAIGLLTTARPVYSHTNFEINQAFYEFVFPAEGEPMHRLGDIVRQTKNKGATGTGVINRNFLLLGDPSMKLASPERRLSLQSLNNEPEATLADTLMAFARVRANGVVTDSEGRPDVSFNGLLEAVVYEKPVSYETMETSAAKMQFSMRNNVIFRGKARVKEGAFSFLFTVPKSIRYTPGQGKISLYAVADDSTADASGQYNDFIIGNSKPNYTSDTRPPQIKLFLNDSSFVNGESVGKESWLLAYLSDESGINITNTGIHEGVVATLDGETTFLLNDYYSAATDDFTKGSLRFPLQGLAAGAHTLSITARDTYNNLAKTEIHFIVSDKGDFQIYSLLNYPNPFRGHTKFVVEHSRAGEPLEASLSIYNLKGQMLYKSSRSIESSLRRFTLQEWNGQGQGGQNLPEGIYLFKIVLRSLTDGSATEKTEKLVILN